MHMAQMPTAERLHLNMFCFSRPSVSPTHEGMKAASTTPPANLQARPARKAGANLPNPFPNFPTSLCSNSSIANPPQPCFLSGTTSKLARAARGEIRFLKGHDFSRALSRSK
jgi:hypothetical protein